MSKKKSSKKTTKTKTAAKKSKSSKKTSFSIVQMAADTDPYGRRLKLDRPEYQEFLEILEEFVFSRWRNEHNCGLNWFLNKGMPRLNDARLENGEDPIPHDLSENTLLRHMTNNWPEQAKCFRRP